MRLVISDARPGLVEAARSVMAGAAWRRCRTHYLRNLLTKVPESAQPLVATLVRSIFAQPDAAQVHLVPQGAPAPDLVDQPPGAAQQGDPPAHPTSWAPFPTRASVLRLVDAVLAETHDEWADTRRYMTVDALLRLEKAA